LTLSIPRASKAAMKPVHTSPLPSVARWGGAFEGGSSGQVHPPETAMMVAVTLE